MEKHRRLAIGIAAQFPVDLVSVTGIEKSVLIGFD